MREIILVPFLGGLFKVDSWDVPSSHFEAFDEFFDFPYRDVFICS